jgi:hypothetical protein
LAWPRSLQRLEVIGQYTHESGQARADSRYSPRLVTGAGAPGFS